MDNHGWLVIFAAGLGGIIVFAFALALADLFGLLPATNLDRAARERAGDRAAQVQITAAQHQVPPALSHLTISPHYAPHNTQQQTAPLAWEPEPEQATQVLTEAELPGPCTLLDVMQRTGFTPTPGRILLGLGPGGDLLTVPASDDLCHVLITGTTDGGKSSLFRLLMAQLLYAGVPVFWLDPHYADFDNKARADWRPLAARFAGGGPLVAEDRITQALGYLVGPEMEKRKLTRQRTGDPGPALFVGTDEWATQVDSQSVLARHLAKFVREARKFNQFLGIASQGATVATLGITGDVRQQFNTVYDVGGNRRVRPEILGLPQNSPEPQGKGHVYLKSPVTQKIGQLVRVPWADNPSIYELLGWPQAPPPWGWDSPPRRSWPGVTLAANGAPMGAIPTMEAPVVAEARPPTPTIRLTMPDPPAPSPLPRPSLAEIDPRAPRVVELLQQNVGAAGIVKEVWGVSGGRAYQEAAVELTGILAKLTAGYAPAREEKINGL